MHVCKFTLLVQIIPERMQDCSYFLKGMRQYIYVFLWNNYQGSNTLSVSVAGSCSNESCPYRHVNVDPDSPVCESFVRGYCADGNEV